MRYIKIRYVLHKESFVFSFETFYAFCNRSGYEMLNLTVEHIFAMESLKCPEDAPRHRDPFEQFLSAGKTERMHFIKEQLRYRKNTEFMLFLNQISN